MAFRVSLCLIVKNEEACLPACLASAADLVDEIIVVDTGSTDRSKEIAADFQARLFGFAWVDDFSAARNESIRRATGDWIFYLDADEYLDHANREKLRALLNGLRNDNRAYALKQRSRLARERRSDVVAEQVRLFRNRTEHRWQYRVHEQILPALESTGASIHQTDVVVEHSGYQDPLLSSAKLERNLKLLLVDYEERPQDPYVLFNLGWTYLDQGRAAEALSFLRDSQQRIRPDATYLPVLYGVQVNCLQQLGQWEKALSVCQAGRARFPEDASLLFHEGLLRRQRDDAKGAEACFRQLLKPDLSPDPSPKRGGESPTSPPSLSGKGAGGLGGGCQLAGTHGFQPLPAASRFVCAIDGLQGHLARHHLALVLSDQGRLTEAEAEWRAALEEAPAYTPAEIELIKLFLTQESREDEAEKALRNVLQRDPDQLDCWRNLARLLRNQDRHGEVVEVCREGRRIFPDDPELLRLQRASLESP